MGSILEDYSRVPNGEGQYPVAANEQIRLANLHAEDSDIISCQAALFEWAESFDTKDWTRLAGCIAPTLYVRSLFSSSDITSLTTYDL